GETAFLALHLVRDGVTGPAALTWSGLPADVTVKELKVAADAQDVLAEVTAGDNVVATTVDVTGRATVGGVHGEARFRLTTRTPTLQFEPIPPLALYPGERKVLSFKIKRQGYLGPVIVKVEGLPRDFARDEAIIPAGQDTGTLAVTAPVNVREEDRLFEVKVV